MNIHKKSFNKKGLVEYLHLLQKEGFKMRVWWRDDDVFEATEELNKLIQFSEKNGVPVHLSVIPKNLTDNAIDLLKSQNKVTILQHGYSHTNYAKVGEPLNEYGMNRALDDMLNDIRYGFYKLSEVFGEQFVPIFVPPWGHIAQPVLEQLHEIGFVGISLIGNNNKTYSSLKNMNTHIDIHSWKTKSENSYDVKMRPFEMIADDIIKIITSAKSQKNGHENIGLLTHSQIMKDNDWEIFTQLITQLKDADIEIINWWRDYHLYDQSLTD